MSSKKDSIFDLITLFTGVGAAIMAFLDYKDKSKEKDNDKEEKQKHSTK